MKESFSILPRSRDPNDLPVKLFRRGLVAPHFQTQQTRSWEPENANDQLQLGISEKRHEFAWREKKKRAKKNPGNWWNSFSDEMVRSWDDLKSVVEQVSLSGGRPWCSNLGLWKNWVYSSKKIMPQNFYAITNCESTGVYFFESMVPPKIQLFLWLLSHNKLDSG